MIEQECEAYFVSSMQCPFHALHEHQHSESCQCGVIIASEHSVNPGSVGQYSSVNPKKYVIMQAQGDLSGCMQSLRDILYNLLAKLVKLGAYSHCNVDQASAFSLDGAMKTYHAQTSNTVSKCGFLSFCCIMYGGHAGGYHLSATYVLQCALVTARQHTHWQSCSL